MPSMLLALNDIITVISPYRLKSSRYLRHSHKNIIVMVFWLSKLLI
ncbi:hypothetical protein C3B55_00569 [Candidatus Pseudomonas adelgestsugas]|uniref:Uncharacterized protein n=1 Tax=Candidatus Pseudomonas adelgestsugas TaxID=1302376 RepID=A0ABX5R8E4_9PSED|nr:hypothetical protein C3B55_00569 [Candidatus Pseudomonas adelgestsugas]